jgi:hypothetical protein
MQDGPTLSPAKAKHCRKALSRGEACVPISTIAHTLRRWLQEIVITAMCIDPKVTRQYVSSFFAGRSDAHASIYDGSAQVMAHNLVCLAHQPSSTLTRATAGSLEPSPALLDLPAIRLWPTRHLPAVPQAAPHGSAQDVVQPAVDALSDVIAARRSSESVQLNGSVQRRTTQGQSEQFKRASFKGRRRHSTECID